MSWTPRTIAPRWARSRQRLQDRYAQVSRLPDASRLAYLRGRPHTRTEKDIAEVWAKAVAQPAQHGPTLNNLYIHVPFCKSLCTFCNYQRLRPSSPDQLHDYLDRLETSMATIGPAVRDLEWHTLYVGGGTPSTLPAHMLDRLFTSLAKHFRFAKNASRSFEFDPMVMNASRIAVLKKHGFNHFSFGIQTLSPEVNRAHNRGPQGRETIAKRFEELYAAGLHDVAVDFLLGLAGTTPQEIVSDIEWVLDNFRPRRVDVFQISPTVEYVDAFFGGDIDRYWAHLEEFETGVAEAIPAIAKRLGYSTRSGGGHRFAMHRTTLPKGWPSLPERLVSYTQLVNEARQPLHLLGLGPSARSQVFGHAAYHCQDLGNQPGDGAMYTGQKVGLPDEVRTYLVYHLRDQDTVERDEFKRIFGLDVVDAIPFPLSVWANAGLLEVSKEVIRLKPQSRGERTLTLLWLVPDEALEHEIARRQQLDLSPDGVERLAADLPPGTRLSSQHSFGGVEEGKIVICTPDRLRMRFRVAPGLEQDAPLRLILESSLPSDQAKRTALSRAMVQVRGILRVAESSSR